MFHFCCQSNVYSWNNIVLIVLAFDNLSLFGKRVRIHPAVSATKSKCKLESFVLLEKKNNNETTPPWWRYTYRRDKMINLLTEHWHNQSPKKSVEEDKHFSRKCTKSPYVHRLLEKSSYNIDISYNFTANWDWSTIHQELQLLMIWPTAVRHF